MNTDTIKVLVGVDAPYLFVAVVGDPSTGMALHGPFTDEEEAKTYGATLPNCTGIAQLIIPE